MPDVIDPKARVLLCRTIRAAAKDQPDTPAERQHGINFNRMAMDVQEGRPVEIPSWLALDALTSALGNDA